MHQPASRNCQYGYHKKKCQKNLTLTQSTPQYKKFLTSSSGNGLCVGKPVGSIEGAPEERWTETHERWTQKWKSTLKSYNALTWRTFWRRILEGWRTRWLWCRIRPELVYIACCWSPAVLIVRAVCMHATDHHRVESHVRSNIIILNATCWIH